MKRSDFHYDLPGQLIARYPLPERTDSRLLCLDGSDGSIEHRRFTDLQDLLQAGDLLVLNNTRVIPARVWGRKTTGGKVEILLERIVSETECLAHVRASKSPRPGSLIHLLEQPDSECVTTDVEVIGRQDELFHLRLSAPESWLPLLQRIGHMPLPPISTGPMKAWIAPATRRSMPSAMGRWRHRRRACISVSSLLPIAWSVA